MLVSLQESNELKEEGVFDYLNIEDARLKIVDLSILGKDNIILEIIYYQVIVINALLH